MPNLRNDTPQLKLFEYFASHWQAITGSNLLWLSPTGQLVADFASDSASLIDGPKVVNQSSRQETTIINYGQQLDLFIAPLTVDDQLVGYLVAINAQPDEIALLNWVAETMTARLDNEIVLQEMTDELIEAWNQLELIYHVTQNLSLTSDLTAALESILKEIQKVINTEDGFIILKRSPELERISCQRDSEATYLSDQLLDNLVNHKSVVLCNTPDVCAEVWPEMPAFVDNFLATRLIILQEESQAALGLINKHNKEFTAGDVKLLAALAHQVGLVIKNFIIHQELINRERLAREREIAAQIQESFLPSNLPQVGGVSLAVSSTPASEVGGDFYDFVTVDDHQLTLIIGDVSGKGIPAATLTTIIRTVLRTEINRGEAPHKVIEHAREFLRNDLNQAESLVTVLIVTIDSYNGTLSYASAGHMPGILWQAKTRLVKELRATSTPIGLMGYKDETLLTQTIELNPGDSLILFTDGVIEAQSPNDDIFGLHRLKYIIESRASEPPEQMQQYIQSEISKFRRHASHQDDATLLVVKVLPQTSTMSSKNISTIVKTAQYSYAADTSHLTDISQKIISICRQMPSLTNSPHAEDFINLVELAASEICTNIIRHAYKNKSGDIDIHITLLSNGIQLDLYDDGVGFDPNSIPVPKPDQPQEGGYGLHIIRQIMDVVSYQHYPEEGNHWHLVKLFPSP